MQSKNILITIATLIGLFVIGAWAFRILGNFFDNLLWWFRYNGIYVLAAVGVLWIMGKVLFDKDK
jgi:hypothetical protein